MPIYEFKCSCGNTFEKIVLKSTDDISCPICKNPEVIKIMSAASFKFGKSLVKYDVQNADSGKSIVTKTPIIKDRNTGNHLYP